MSLLKKYQDNENLLTKTEKYCFNKILDKIKIDTGITIKSIADELNVSTTTIFRMIKNLGYNSFKDFKYDLLFARREELNTFDLRNMDILNLFEKQINETISYLRDIKIDEIVDTLINSNTVFICGSGMNNYIGRILEVKLNLNNVSAKLSEDSWLMFLETSKLTSKDTIIVLSKTGETKSLVDVVKNCKLNGTKVILIGEIGDSTIASLSDYKIFVSRVEEEGTDMDTRLQTHIAINYLTKKIIERNLLMDNGNEKYGK
ncbi:MAG: MurR/RpiR family transcriptional regulator [Clostridium sp.]|uniref:MurR/RpiR family transcriptional regulator n=1 Tax=Clostridium sp. TaxID=1506 RepID=UPI0025BF6ED2|nr:MurR/RpiR family transcriptional regulator [Clostridium sp.]MBS5927818.1 MurR/RpiR family transcriptional regulator [Clostridium sp.]